MRGRLIAGIDEAGRGSLFGPMVVALFAIEGQRLRELSELGVRDSKALTPRAREQLFDRLRCMGALIRERYVSPEVIDNSSKFRGGRGLNELELKVMRDLIEDVKPDVVYIDSPYRNARRASELMGSVRGVRVFFEVRADAKRSVVAAASIVAKVLRDRAVTQLGEVGSGYPSDPKTIKHLELLISSGHLPEYVRRSWKTVRSDSRLDVFLEGL
ncbi:MAG: ribonuclease HII [Thaumarchaeota archaeon]|nr:ribonuclease HII [Candidatus Calditenuaceae archaeon]MDW8041698.1 ribonuclease HII [Nitrososphaerota archaeon]